MHNLLGADCLGAFLPAMGDSDIKATTCKTICYHHIIPFQVAVRRKAPLSMSVSPLLMMPVSYKRAHIYLQIFTFIYFLFCLCIVFQNVDRAPLGVADEKILTVISFLGCGISSIFLGLTLLTYLLFE